MLSQVDVEHETHIILETGLKGCKLISKNIVLERWGTMVILIVQE
jgi:hypothetical protein